MIQASEIRLVSELAFRHSKRNKQLNLAKWYILEAAKQGYYGCDIPFELSNHNIKMLKKGGFKITKKVDKTHVTWT